MTLDSDQRIAGNDLLALDRQVCFALAIANRAVLSVYRPLLEPMGLTHPQYLVMLALWGKSPMAVKEIGTALQLDSPTLSPLLKRLEASGLITRTRSRADERQLNVELTDAGVALRAEAEKIPPAVIDKLGVSLTELEELHKILTRINQAALRAGALDH
ncbi:MarR family transcriptional regulator [Rhodococcus oxybenzonivorans]|jgi:DNA-binding MarR family transcriptional regulator|uniref:MarR family transcriptional regulator n=1 Tax=Rhodococcus oxybenzonivorans TaxID=1990687 RepID=A0A2S2C0V3_9NOCA|nr:MULTISPECIES: MarR family transcriptional regulator [Rhodococcus]AWK74479.1 MarR family transcriptional regulator [Rhodococcus oxybenzonivorans]QHE70618.1 Organic hydroperoxide resistance transcriptional regulator [Rhodococcus sp. WAY2]